MPFQDNEFLTSDRVRLYYRQSTAPSPNKIVFLHGLTGNRTAWEEYEQFFAAHGYQTFAFDLRGHGKSQKNINHNSFTLARMAQDLVEWANIEKITKFHLVGHCFGGLVSLQATDTPLRDKLSTLTLICPFYQDHRVQPNLLRHLLYAILPLAKLVPLPQLRQSFRYPEYWRLKDKPYPVFLCNDLLSNPLSLYQNGLLATARIDALQTAAHIRIPTYLLAGGKDDFVPPRFVQKLHQTIAGSRYELFPSGDHIVNIRKPDTIPARIHQFIVTATKPML